MPDFLSRSDMLLRSPLGRQMLTSYVGWGPGESSEQALSSRLGLGQVPGIRSLSRSGGDGAVRRWQDVSPATIGKVIRTTVERRSWREALGTAGDAELLADLAGETFSFGFSGGDEAVWGLTALAIEQLRPVADALLASPGARDWWDPVALTDQRFVEWDGVSRFAGQDLERAVRRCMAAERADNAEGLRRSRPAEQPGVIIGARWWSLPDFAQQALTSTAVGGLPALALCQFFDTYLPPDDIDGATVWSVAIDPASRVLEINCPEDWQELVARFPRDVTGTHDGEWRYWSGVPGPWLLPDWEQVMEYYDGVHVSIGAAVCSFGVALPVGDRYTMLTAWLPDATLWLRDTATEVLRLGRWLSGMQLGRWDDHPHEWAPVARVEPDLGRVPHSCPTPG